MQKCHRYGTYQRTLKQVIVLKQEHLSKMQKNPGCRKGRNEIMDKGGFGQRNWLNSRIGGIKKNVFVLLG